MAKKAKAPTKREARMTRESVLWHALAKHGGKLGDRDLLESGRRYEIEATISGVVDGSPVCLPLTGGLIVNHDTTRASSSGPGADKLLACALSRMSASVRQKFVDELTQEDIDKVDPKIASQCDHLLKRLRHTSTQTARGSVRYEPALTSPATEEAEAE